MNSWESITSDALGLHSAVLQTPETTSTPIQKESEYCQFAPTESSAGFSIAEAWPARSARPTRMNTGPVGTQRGEPVVGDAGPRICLSRPEPSNKSEIG